VLFLGVFEITLSANAVCFYRLHLVICDAGDNTFVAIVKGVELGLLAGNPARLRRVGGLLREATLRLWPTTPVIPACF
jgi:hypothetical protein